MNLMNNGQMGYGNKNPADNLLQQLKKTTKRKRKKTKSD